MTSVSGKAVSYFRDVFPELSAMPDDVLVSRIEKLWRIEDDIRCLDSLGECDPAHTGEAAIAFVVEAAARG
jgi:hypothetical protein